jgi:hypothetical protein
MAQAGAGLLEALQELYGTLVAISERPKEQRIELPQLVGNSLDELGPTFKALLDKPPRSKSSRDVVLSGMSCEFTRSTYIAEGLTDGAQARSTCPTMSIASRKTSKRWRSRLPTSSSSTSW